MNIDYTGKTVLITGGTRGIGKAIADCLYEAGANIYLTGTKVEEVISLNTKAQDLGQTRIHFLQVNFSDGNSFDHFLQELSEIEKIDVCINNAGINLINDFCNVSFEEFMQVQQIDVFAPYRVLKAVVPKMKANGYGRIVNIASIWSIITRPGRSSYTTAKNAIVGFTKALAIELAPYNINVNAVSPGFTLTELTQRTNTKEQLTELVKLIPAKRIAEPCEMAHVVAFLCSDYNSYMTGQNITVDGGYTNV